MTKAATPPESTAATGFQSELLDLLDLIVTAVAAASSPGFVKRIIAISFCHLLRGKTTRFKWRQPYFGAIRIARPSRGGNGTILPSDSAMSGGIWPTIGVSKIPGAMVITRMP